MSNIDWYLIVYRTVNTDREKKNFSWEPFSCYASTRKKALTKLYDHCPNAAVLRTINMDTGEVYE